MNYDYKYLIKIVSAPNKLIWFYNYIGVEFETTSKMKGKKLFYYVDHLHAIPAEHCIVIKKTEVIKYIPKYKNF
jgi:hypothetical protein